MNKPAFAAVALGVCLASPAFALEHEVVIDSPAGPIAADYEGSVKIEQWQTGAPGVAGRRGTLRCNWTASLDVERIATIGEVLKSRHSLSQDEVASGSKPGWCNTRAIARQVENQQEAFRAAMLTLVEQDRSTLLAEADNLRGGKREG